MRKDLYECSEFWNICLAITLQILCVLIITELYVWV